MRFLNDQRPPYDLTYADVFMAPSRSAVTSRLDVDLTTPDGVGTSLPVIVANMNAVAGRRMAETMARRGGIAILPQDSPLGIVEKAVRRVKDAHPVFETPVTVQRTEVVAHAQALLTKRAHGVAVVLDGERPVGVVTERDMQEVDRFEKIEEVMSPTMSTVGPATPLDQVFDKLVGLHVSMLPVVEDDRLLGVLTRKSVLRSGIYKPALDPNGRLMVGAAVGINGDVAGRARTLLDMGIDALVVDTAHGHQEKMFEALPAVVAERDRHQAAHGRRIPIAAGNIVTAEGSRELVEAGADIIKVGVGPGAMCTTRMMTGVGRPQFSAVLECAGAARELGAHVWADGGVKYPRDVALALAAGASSVMIGSWFAGTYESAGDMSRDPQGRLYKENYGMASTRAVQHRTRERSAFERARLSMFEEGISSSRMYVDPARPGVEDLIDSITAGVRSAFTYAGAASIGQFHGRAVVGTQSTAGYEEGRPHPTSW